MARQQLTALRKQMAAIEIDALIIPSTDPHQSEYVPAPWQRRAYVSGFTGSAGDVALTAAEAALWTDSRYFLQAEKQLGGSGIALERVGLPETPSIPEWLSARLTQGMRVGVDPLSISAKIFKKYQRSLASSGILLVSLDDNPVDAIWTDRPPLPEAPIRIHPLSLSGQGAEEKLTAVRQAAYRQGASCHVVTSLDAIAWLFNIRGEDVAFTPVAIAYAAVERHTAHLFTSPKKVTPELKRHLEGIVEIHPYTDFPSYLKEISSQEDVTVLIDEAATSQWTADRLEPGRIISRESPISGLKARKNNVELEGMAAAHLRDGAAMVSFLSWLDEALPARPLTELEAADKLAGFRAAQADYLGPSFSTISAFGPNGAIVHYEPDETSNARIAPDGLYLIDSGGQYRDGTTDITRTIAVGPPTEAARRCFTQVLKGHIALASAVFPQGTTGPQLDTIARKPLWDIGRNYGHGTGHGVGAHLSVHEGPQAISYYRGMGVPLEEGMVLSIEPGCYVEGEWGIRIENLVRVIRHPSLSSPDTAFLAFEPLTLCPIDLRLVDRRLLERQEREYLDAYHERVLRAVSPLLSAPERAWLEAATRPVSR